MSKHPNATPQQVAAAEVLGHVLGRATAALVGWLLGLLLLGWLLSLALNAVFDLSTPVWGAMLLLFVVSRIVVWVKR